MNNPGYGPIVFAYFVGQPPVVLDDVHAEFAIGFLPALLPDTEGSVYLGDLVVHLPEAECCEIYAGPTDPASIPLHPAYLDGDGQLAPLGFVVDPNGENLDADGWLTIPAATVICGAVNAERTSWSDIRRLYR